MSTLTLTDQGVQKVSKSSPPSTATTSESMMTSMSPGIHVVSVLTSSSWPKTSAAKI
jgi:hypothetical protein